MIKRKENLQFSEEMYFLSKFRVFLFDSWDRTSSFDSFVTVFFSINPGWISISSSYICFRFTSDIRWWFGHKSVVRRSVMKRRNKNLDMYKMAVCLYFIIVPEVSKLYKGDNSTISFGHITYVWMFIHF